MSLPPPPNFNKVLHDMTYHCLLYEMSYIQVM